MSLPVVDLRAAASCAGRIEQQRRVMEGLTGPGFLYLDNIRDYDPQELKALTLWFFGLPLENRMKISKKMFQPSSEYTYRGYFPVQPGQQSHKEAFEMGSFMDGPGEAPDEASRLFFEDNQWPTDPPGQPPFAHKFRERMEHYYSVLSEAGLELLRLVAEGWGVDRETCTTMFNPKPLSTFRLLHYPSRGKDLPECALKDDIVLQCDEHQDSGFVTMLETFEYRGLQRLDEHDRWVDVPHREGSLIVNLGLLLARMTGGAVRATMHRVLDYGEDRFSVPFFLEPSYHANVNVKLPPRLPALRQLDDPLPAEGEGQSAQPEPGSTTSQKPQGGGLLQTGPHLPYGRWLLHNLVTYIEYESLKQFLPAEEGGYQ